MATNDKFTNDDRYWASVPSTEIADRILDKVDQYYKYVTQTGRLAMWKRSHAYYYRPRLTGARLNATGEQGELTAMSVNHYRNWLQHLETMTMQQKVMFQPKATNSDAKSQAQVVLSSSLLDYYMSEKRLERNIAQAVKESLMYCECFVRAEWDATLGKTYGSTETGSPVYEGDIKYTTYNPLNAIRDVTKMSPGQDDWIILREFQNKYTIAAKFPHLKKEIMDNSVDYLKLAGTTSASIMALEDSDNIPVYTLLHKSTPALNTGRFTTCLDNGTVMQDGPIPYEELHVYRIAPDEESGTIFGFSVGMDLLAIQEALDILYSTVISNQASFGVMNVMAPKGHDLSVTQLPGGMNLMEYDYKLGEVKVLELLRTPAEIFNFIEMLIAKGDALIGQTPAISGNSTEAVKSGMSGTALALLQSMAIQFSMKLQRSYTNLIEDIGTGTINLLKVFAATPRVAAIVGKSNRPLMREFTGQDLDLINRVTVDMGNPMMSTTAGKVSIAEQLISMNMIENADQYMQVITTGRLEPIIEGKQAQLILIKGENEQLSEGIPQRVLATDNHQKHILDHTIILSNPEIRQDPNSPIVAVTLAHIQEHLDMANNPEIQRIMMILHQEPIPPSIAPQGLGGMMNPAPAQEPRVPEQTDPGTAQVISEQISA